MGRTERARRCEAGVTLVEVLVVLVLIGAVAGAVGLGFGAGDRDANARTEATLLAARMRLASEEAVLEGRPVALVWSSQAYRFETLAENVWEPHPISLLGTPKVLDARSGFLGEAAAGGAFIVTAAALPESGAPLVIALGPIGAEAATVVRVRWDGATATVLEEAQ